MIFLPAWKARLFFVASAAGVALALRVAWSHPPTGIALLVAVLLAVAWRWRTRRRVRRVFRSGDVERVLGWWHDSMRRIPHPETMAPLMTATAFAAYGWLEKAREALRHAERGPAWDAAIEHRLFLDTLLLTFEGDGDEALKQAQALSELPLPVARAPLVDRVRTLRGAVAALARAFAHVGEPGDRQLLLRAGEHSPLVHWAMRYGAAVLAVDRGALEEAQGLIDGAPAWPSQSCFRGFHDEIDAEVRRRRDAEQG
ncbi:MAG: hypothetical protein AAGN82_28470 [Myxococcota bacterium]